MLGNGKKRKRLELFHSIDVLSDGSEGTGDGTVFLSVWKNKEGIAAENPLARYALNGFGDSTSRLVADQRLKLATLRAVFTSSLQNLWGLPAIQLALHKAGSAEVSIVSPHCDRVEKLTKLLESRRQSHPKVSLCQIPSSPNSNTWWHVYNDEFVTVFATERGDIPVYLFSVASGDQRRGILVLPPTVDSYPQNAKDLPSAEGAPIEIDLTLSLMTNESAVNPPTFFTYPCQQNLQLDPGILVRAQAQGKFWQQCRPDLFSWLSTGTRSYGGKNQLRSGFSLWLDTHQQLCRMNDPDFDVPKAKWSALMSGFLKHTSTSTYRENLDDNEISLSEEDSDNDNKEEENQPDASHPCTLGTGLPVLHILGTGCASPSPRRGASGYALQWKEGGNEDSIVVEAGEGFCTQWYRHVSPSLSSVRLIWISHAHWDHYGGLATLLWKIHEENVNAGNFERVRPPKVLAPTKVLNVLNLMFVESSLFFIGIAHELSPRDQTYAFQDFTLSNGRRPVEFWYNIAVQHSCPAYGFLAGFFQSQQQSPYLFCFSGDTIPCQRLIHVCRNVSPKIDFLLHEATFGDDEKEMGATKKHSTIGQAVQVMESVGAKRLLLTHFSQRYDDPSSIQEVDARNVGYAFDGMYLHL